MLASTANTVTFSVIGFVLVLAIVVVWRILMHDKTIRRIRLGIFYERERERDDDEPRKYAP